MGKNARNGHLVFRSEGRDICSCELSKGMKASVPEPPERKGFRFNGWWVTANESVTEFSQSWLDGQALDRDIIVNARWLHVSYRLEVQDFDTDGYVQDGCIFNDFFFKFHSDGKAVVHSMVSHEELGTFVLDKADIFQPHCNATCFGNTYVEDSDQFPLLYANIYNSYGKESDRRLGHFGVYRIFKDQNGFSSKLIQIIKIGFTDNNGLWHSANGIDRSPYGNFVVDTDKNHLWAFVTRDQGHSTRFFCFDLPCFKAGKMDERYGVPVLELEVSDIQTLFDVPYSYYLQGACYHDGRIYSTEGLGTDDNPSVIRVVDLEAKAEDFVADVQTDGYKKEAEFIDIWNGFFWYGTYMKADSPKAPVFRIVGF